jgi:hypothetical protein
MKSKHRVFLMLEGGASVDTLPPLAISEDLKAGRKLIDCLRRMLVDFSAEC